jgi:hypothetical protein
MSLNGIGWALVNCLDFKKSTSGAKEEAVTDAYVGGVLVVPADVEGCRGGLQ